MQHFDGFLLNKMAFIAETFHCLVCLGHHVRTDVQSLQWLVYLGPHMRLACSVNKMVLAESIENSVCKHDRLLDPGRIQASRRPVGQPGVEGENA